MAANFNNKVIAYVEARMRSEMGSIIHRHGGIPYSAPVLQEVYLKDRDADAVPLDLEDVLVGVERLRLLGEHRRDGGREARHPRRRRYIVGWAARAPL